MIRPTPAVVETFRKWVVSGIVSLGSVAAGFAWNEWVNLHNEQIRQTVILQHIATTLERQNARLDAIEGDQRVASNGAAGLQQKVEGLKTELEWLRNFVQDIRRKSDVTRKIEGGEPS